MWTLNNKPKVCPFGHELGPGKATTSWDMSVHKHFLLCGACNRRSQIALEVEGAEWQVYRDGKWVNFSSSTRDD